MFKPVISASPHLSSENSVKKLMTGVIIALIPVLFSSIWFFGTGAIIVTSVSVISCVLFEFLAVKFLLKKETTITDGSAIITGLLLAFNLPSNLPVWLVVIGAFFSIVVVKISFGGLGNNIFNPALAGRVFLLISWPVQMTSWPKPSPLTSGLLKYTDVTTGATPLGVMSEGLRSGETIEKLTSRMPDYIMFLTGNTGGSLGEVSALAILAGLIYMLVRKIITWHIPVSVLGTLAVFTALLHIANPDKFASPLFHILSGGIMLGAVFMATDYVTSPMSKRGMLVYGVGIGILTTVIRIWGDFPEGVSFAILIMNAFVPLINMYIKPVRFGKSKK